MKVVIIEDEAPAQELIQRLIRKYYPDFRIVSILDSIDASISFLRENAVDLIFMDVELSDGNCFEIFKEIDVKAPIIVTTAYEDYALNAFKAKCIDYLLKPIEEYLFKESVDRFLNLYLGSKVAQESPKIEVEYKQRFTINFGTQILIVDVSRIAYFYSSDKSTYLVTVEGKQYLMDMTLDNISEMLDPRVFYKISRGAIVSVKSISNISKYFNSRLKVSLSPAIIDPIVVSRARSGGFLEWLEISQ